jgi:cytochrome c peroxidase
MKTTQKIGITTAAVAFVFMIACKKETVLDQNENVSSTPVLPAIPDNYAASSNDALATLGRVLFYDKNLSLNNSVSCSSCHQQSKAFCDNLKASVGLENVNTSRNSPSLFAKQGRMFWDGRANSLNDLTLRPIKNHVEMKFDNLTQLAEKITNIGYYPLLFQKAFGTSKIDSIKIQKALADFLNNFNFSNNKFKRSQKGGEQLTATESIGKDVFFSKGRCFNCHHIESNDFPGGGSGYGFTNQSFNIGLDLNYGDKGIAAISGDKQDEGQFMVPALLNVEYTAPYMHDGRFKTLEEVVEHYNSGIQNHPNLSPELRNLDFQNMSQEEILALLDTNKDGDIDDSEVAQLSNMQPVKLGLTDSEKRCLVAFLKTLSDPSIFSDQKFSNPFVAK